MKISLQLQSLSIDLGSSRDPLNIAITMLSRAYFYAVDSGANPWQFALEIEELRKRGVTNSEFRWLLTKGLICHARELPATKAMARRFAPLSKPSFESGTCFVISEGLAREISKSQNRSVMTRSIQNLESSNSALRICSGPAACERGEANVSPRWNAITKELSLGSKLIKRFKAPAPNQEKIIATFEEENWPQRIDDPLPPAAELDCRRRLTDTIKYLNRNQVNCLIRFRGDGTGSGILWKSNTL